MATFDELVWHCRNSMYRSTFASTGFEKRVMYGALQEYKQKLKDLVTDRENAINKRFNENRQGWVYSWTQDYLKSKTESLKEITAKIEQITYKDITNNAPHLELCQQINNVDV